jgi:hypothetical protein
MPLCHVAVRIKIVRRSKKKLDMTSATKPRQSVKQFDVVRTTGSVDGGPFIKVIPLPTWVMKHTLLFCT